MVENYLQNLLHHHTESKNSVYFISDRKGTLEILTTERALSAVLSFLFALQTKWR